MGQLMRLSYSQQALVGGGGDLALAALLKQPSQMSSAAHLEPLRNPGQRHGGLRTQLPGELYFLGLALTSRFKVGLTPAYPFEPLNHPPFGLHHLRLLHHLSKVARPRPRLHLFQELLPKVFPAPAPTPFHPLALTPQILPSPPLHSLRKHAPSRLAVLRYPPFPQQPIHPQPARTPRRRGQIPRITAPAKGRQRLLGLEDLRPRRIQMHVITHRLEIAVAAPIHD